MSKVIPDGWRKCLFSDLVKLDYGKSPKNIFNESGKYPVIGTGGITGFTDDFLHGGNTTVIGRKGTINKPSFITNRFWPIDTTYFVSEHKDSIPKWFYYITQDIDLTKYNEASGVPSLNRDTLYAISYVVPPVPEQQKIAAILTAVDEVIETTQAQINKLKDLKIGLMQELLTQGIGHTEFKDSPVGRIPNDWRVLSMDFALDAVIDYRGKSPPKSASGIPLITAKNIRCGYLALEPKEFIYEDQYDSWMVRGTPRNGDVFITSEAPLGNVARVPSYKFAVGQRVLTLRPNKSILDSDYLLFLMQGQYFKEQLELESTGSTVAGIKQSTFRQILIPIPPLCEQLNIAKSLNSLVDTEHCLLKKNNQILAIKKALMQDLLTGKVRVETV